MDIKGFKSRDGSVHQYDYESLANIPEREEVDLTGIVKSVNGVTPDENGNVKITIPDSSENVELDTTLTVAGKAADAKAVGDKFAEITGISLVEPAEDDIPKIFFGGALQQTKDEAVVPFRYISKTDDFSGYAEIKAQGNSSMSYPKKNQNAKLFKDADCSEKLKFDFKGWGKQNKYCFKANWIDLSHARNVVSARLWGDVVKSRANYAELPELLRTSPNQGAIDGFPVKVYAAGVYQGRYTLNIPKDKWTFNMDDDINEHCVLYSENYGSGCFRGAATINGSDWTDEIHDVTPESIKTRWNEVISFVMNSTDEEFVANLNQYFYVDSLIDYYLFGLASCGLDAFGKNQIYATYDGQKWVASMYDMDSTWGNWFTGGLFVESDYDRSEYQDFKDGQGNLLYIRLEKLFWSEIQARWAELKNGALSMENIINRFERFTDIAPVELVKDDYATTTGGGAFTAIPSKSTNNIQQIRVFALERQAWTDAYMAALTPEIPVPCEGISLDKSTLTFTAEGTQTLTATVIPDGCTDTVTWESTSVSVATVNDGVVTAIANGSATITAKCGNYSASCEVSVSGIYEAVPCTGITLDKTELELTEVGESQTIVATVTPTDTTDPIVWNSNNEAVAKVENGVVTAVGEGSCTITATCGAYNASCSVSMVLSANPILYHGIDVDVNGVNVDTGIALMDTDRDFTFMYDAILDNAPANNGYWFHLTSAVVGNANVGVVFGGWSGLVKICVTPTFEAKATPKMGGRARFVASHTKGTGEMHWYIGYTPEGGSETVYTGTATYELYSTANKLSLRSNGNSTVKECVIYSYAMSADEVSSQFGITV